jgi:hypothetical protein
MRAFVVAHAGPFIGPPASATIAFVEVEKSGHASLLGSQTIIAARNEVDKSAIAQILKLLLNLGFDVLVARIEIAQMPLEGIHFVKREVAFAEDSTHFMTSSSQPRVSGDSSLRKSVFCHSARTNSFARMTPL